MRLPWITIDSTARNLYSKLSPAPYTDNISIPSPVHLRLSRKSFDSMLFCNLQLLSNGSNLYMIEGGGGQGRFLGRRLTTRLVMRKITV